MASSSSHEASPVLAFALAGVVSGGDGGPRMLHRRTGEGYDPALAVDGRVATLAGGVSLRFARPPVPVDFILLEPVAVPGRYRILRLAVAGEPLAEPARRVLGPVDGPVRPLDDAGVWIEGAARPPVLELDLRGIEWPDGDLEVVLRRDGDAGPCAVQARLLDRVSEHHRNGQAAFARLGRELADAAESLRQVARAAATLESGQEQLAASVTDVRAALAQQERAVARQELGLAQQELGLAQQEQALATLAGVVERTAAERASSEAAAHAAALAAAEAGRAEATAAAASQHAATLQALAELRAQLDRVQHAVENVFWRRWLRRLRGAR